MNSKIRFAEFHESHLVLLRGWLTQPHVSKFWQESDDDSALRNKFLSELPRRGIHAFIFEVDGHATGFIQYYEAIKVGNGWWEAEKAGTFGIDLMIGEKVRVGKGLGPRVIEAFLDFIVQRETLATSFIRCFEKAGFSREGEILTPGGPALLMRRS